MAIVERQTTVTRSSNIEAENDAGTGILVVLAIIVALAAAYFAYDYYATPANDMSPMTSSTVVDDTTVSASPATVAPADTTTTGGTTAGQQ